MSILRNRNTSLKTKKNSNVTSVVLYDSEFGTIFALMKKRFEATKIHSTEGWSEYNRLNMRVSMKVFGIMETR